jgi:hypothetical protein
MNLETLPIDDLAALRGRVLMTLADKVAARQKELLAESERVGALVTSKPSTARSKRPVKYRRRSKRMVRLWDDAGVGKGQGRDLENYRV